MILLSFDTEEFDVPREYGVEWNTLTDGMEVSKYGICRILDVLKKECVRTTFFCTANFAEHAPEMMQRIMREGHEVAAHGCDHWQPHTDDVVNSKKRIEAVLHSLGYTDFIVNGYRQPRMFPISDDLIEQEGYLYNSSLNPTFIPGRYMHFREPRIPFWHKVSGGTQNGGRGVLEIPVSVTPYFRFPLFWLAMHNLPMRLYKYWCQWAWRHDGQFVTYFHPWEFYQLNEHPELKMPFIITRNCGEVLTLRLGDLIRMFKNKGGSFITYKEYTCYKIQQNRKK